MDKVLIDIEVINGIINTYNRSSGQTRIFGLILGTQKNHIYYISDAIYGYIFENTSNDEKDKIPYYKINSSYFNSVLNSNVNKFKHISLSKVNDTTKEKGKEKEKSFLTNENLVILGGFITDRELNDQIHFLYSTLLDEQKNNFKKNNSIFLLIDPNHQDSKKLKYGVKTYLWEDQPIKISSTSNKFLLFRQIENKVIQNVNISNTADILSNNTFNPEFLFFDNENTITKDKTLQEILKKNEEKNNENSDKNSKNDNYSYIQKKIKQSLKYLEIFEKFLEEKKDKNCEGEEADEEAEVLDKISFVLSKLEPFLCDKDIFNLISADINKNKNVNSFLQLLQVQLNISEKIQKLIQ